MQDKLFKLLQYILSLFLNILTQEHLEGTNCLSDQATEVEFFWFEIQIQLIFPKKKCLAFKITTFLIESFNICVELRL